MEENQGYQATLGQCATTDPTPYWCSLAASYASLTSFYAIHHPSLPNYLAFDSGSTQGCNADSCATGYTTGDLGGQLTTAGIPWTAYMESMPAACDPVVTTPLYVLKHDPFLFFTDVTANTSSCDQDVVPYPGASSLVATLDGTMPPDFVWITPNVCDDMHGAGSKLGSCYGETNPELIAGGDAWLSANLAPILSSTWFTGSPSTVIVTMDENDNQSTGSCCGDATGGQVPAVVISSAAAGVGPVSGAADLYGLLRSIEEVYGLPLLGAAASSSNGDLSSLFG